MTPPPPPPPEKNNNNKKKRLSLLFQYEAKHTLESQIIAGADVMRSWMAIMITGTLF